MKYEYSYDKLKRHRNKVRDQAILKLAQGKEPKCSICDCPHAEILHIGHPNHDGSWHRRKLNQSYDKSSRGLIKWIRDTSIEEVLQEVQLECPYCNAWHNRFREYPPPEKRPKW